MAKIRSLAQRIGETGEALVKLWASKNNLSASKIENDFGFDFVIQHFNAHGKNQIASGIFFLAQCKASEQKDSKYIKITRNDALLYLSSSMPFCILSVDNNKEKVLFKFNDHDLVDKLIKFIHDTSNDSLNIDIKSFQDKDKLEDEIINKANGAIANDLKFYIVEKLIKRHAPETKIRTIHSENKKYLFLNPKWITSIINPDSIFSNTEVVDYIINFNVVKILQEYLPSFDAISISGEFGTSNTISADKGKKNTIAISYPIDGNVAYRIKSGFVFNAGPCIEKDGQHIHECCFELKKSDFCLVDCHNDCETMAEMYNKNSLSINGHCFISNLKSWKQMENLFWLCGSIYKAQKTGLFDFSYIYISDLNNDELSKTLIVISGLINSKNGRSVFPGFTFETVTDLDEIIKEEEKGFVPLVFSVKGKKYLAYLESKFSWLINKITKTIIGFELGEIIKIKITELNWDVRAIPTPELWLVKEWPAIPITGKQIKIRFDYEERPYSITNEQPNELLH
jgi:hypothetical protein